MKRLAGCTFVIPRTSGGRTPFSSTLVEEGATVVEFPVVTIGPPPDPEALDGAIQRIDAFRWAVFCHVSAARIFLERFLELKGGLMSLGDACSLAAIGPQRRASVEAYGLGVELTPTKASPAELLKELVGACGDLEGTEVLLVSGEPPGPLTEDLEGLGAAVTHVQSAQRTVSLERHGEVERLLGEGGLTGVVFLSPGGVAQFQGALERCEALEDLPRLVPAYALSPRTADKAKALGFREVRSPKEASREGLLETICEGLQD